MAQMTVRVDDSVIEYREQACSQGRKKKFFDQEVYDYYIKHHPDPLRPTIENKHIDQEETS